MLTCNLPVEEEQLRMQMTLVNLIYIKMTVLHNCLLFFLGSKGQVGQLWACYPKLPLSRLFFIKTLCRSVHSQGTFTLFMMKLKIKIPLQFLCICLFRCSYTEHYTSRHKVILQSYGHYSCFYSNSRLIVMDSGLLWHFRALSLI